MYVLLYLEFYAPTFTSVEILRATELSPSRSDSKRLIHVPTPTEVISDTTSDTISDAISSACSETPQLPFASFRQTLPLATLFSMCDQHCCHHTPLSHANVFNLPLHLHFSSANPNASSTALWASRKHVPSLGMKRRNRREGWPPMGRPSNVSSL